MRQLIVRKSTKYLIAAITPALITQTALAVDVTTNATFKTQDQSLFQTGEALVSIEEKDFFGFTWDERILPDDGLVIGNPNDPDTFEGGVAIGGYTFGRIGFQYNVLIDSGSIDATLPYEVTLDLPSFEELQDAANTPSSNTVYVGTSANFLNNAVKISTISPTFQFKSDLVFDVNAGVEVKGAVDLGFEEFSGQTSIPVIGRPLDEKDDPDGGLFELIAINDSNDGEVRLLDGLNVVKDLIDDTKSTAELVRDTARNAQEATKPDKVSVSLGKPSFDVSVGAVEDIMTAEVALPFIRLNETDNDTVVEPDSYEVKGSDTFANVNLDLDALLSRVVPQVPPLTLGVEADVEVGSASATVTLLDVDFNTGLRLDQSAEISVAETDIELVFDFGREINVGVVDPSDGSVDMDLRDSITITAGQELAFEFDGDNVNLDPVYRIKDAKLKSLFELALESGFSARH